MMKGFLCIKSSPQEICSESLPSPCNAELCSFSIPKLNFRIFFSLCHELFFLHSYKKVGNMHYLSITIYMVEH